MPHPVPTVAGTDKAAAGVTGAGEGSKRWGIFRQGDKEGRFQEGVGLAAHVTTKLLS